MYHPFRPNPLGLFLIYTTLATWTSYFRWLMRRRPSLIRIITIARVGRAGKVVGTCTLRGERYGDLGWVVRAGLATSEGYRGQRVGLRTLHAAGLIAYDLGIRWQIGSVFVSNIPLIRLQETIGARIFPIPDRDPFRPDEPRLGTVVELKKFLDRRELTEPAPPKSSGSSATSAGLGTPAEQ